MPIHLFLPLVAAAGYSLSSLFYKKAYDAGVSTTRAFHWANISGMILLGGVTFLGQGMAWADWWKPVAASALIYLGQLATFAAMRAGDVSMVTPLLGLKVVVVALMMSVASAQGPSARVWQACILTALGVFLTGKPEFKLGRGFWPAFLLVLVSCGCFALADVLIQDWAPRCGGFTFLGLIAVVVGLFSLLHLGLVRLRSRLLGCLEAGDVTTGALVDPAIGRQSLIWGSVLLAAQGIAMGMALGFYNDVARVNVAYGSRGLWSIALVWLLGRRLGVAEVHGNAAALPWRLAGCLLVTAGVVLALWPGQ